MRLIDAAGDPSNISLPAGSAALLTKGGTEAILVYRFQKKRNQFLPWNGRADSEECQIYRRLGGGDFRAANKPASQDILPP